MISGRTGKNTEVHRGKVMNEEKDEFDLLEQSFLRLIISRIQERKICFKEFATQVWPELSEATAVGKFREMRHGSWKTGKPQRITISAASRMAQFLGEDLSYLLCVSRENVRKGRTLTA